MYLQRGLCRNVPGSLIRTIPELKTTQMLIYRQIDKQIVLHFTQWNTTHQKKLKKKKNQQVVQASARMNLRSLSQKPRKGSQA